MGAKSSCLPLTLNVPHTPLGRWRIGCWWFNHHNGCFEAFSASCTFSFVRLWDVGRQETNFYQVPFMFQFFHVSFLFPVITVQMRYLFLFSILGSDTQ